MEMSLIAIWPQQKGKKNRCSARRANENNLCTDSSRIRLMHRLLTCSFAHSYFAVLLFQMSHFVILKHLLGKSERMHFRSVQFQSFHKRTCVQMAKNDFSAVNRSPKRKKKEEKQQKAEKQLYLTVTATKVRCVFVCRILCTFFRCQAPNEQNINR